MKQDVKLITSTDINVREKERENNNNNKIINYERIFKKVFLWWINPHCI